MGSGRRIHQRNVELRGPSRSPLRVLGGRRPLSIAAVMLAALTTTAARSTAQPPAPNPTGGVPPVHFVPTIVPNDSILSVTLYASVKPYARGATKIAQHEIELDFGFTTGTVAVVVHVNRYGVIDGISSNNGRLRVYGKPLTIGFPRMAARLKRHGWREGTCTRRDGHFAALGTPDQPHTYIVWTAHRITIAMSTAHSAYARTKTNCAGISTANR